MNSTDLESLLIAYNNIRVAMKYEKKIATDPNLTEALVSVKAVIERNSDRKLTEVTER
jgi:hypothetical protein